MSPRPYRLGRRQAAADETRGRIIAAARELLSAGGGVSGLTIDGIAERAGVARMTVYHQFASKQGLLEALFDSLAATGGMTHMPAVFQRKMPLEAIDGFVATLAHFWTAHRLVLRRLHGLAAIDPAFESAWRTRQGWRREGLTVLVRRLAKQSGRPRGDAIAEAVDVLFALTSFPTFDMLAGETRTPDDVAPIVQRLARATLGADER
jgi:AcrR family transcriptional regulator